MFPTTRTPAPTAERTNAQRGTGYGLTLNAVKRWDWMNLSTSKELRPSISPAATPQLETVGPQSTATKGYLQGTLPVELISARIDKCALCPTIESPAQTS